MGAEKDKPDYQSGLKRFSIGVIRFYQKVLSPLFPPSCIYTPTCSQYAIKALERHGLLRGGFMALWRVMRCTPFHRGGIDTVK
jgi:putative membrane protein insertion efficiency factor